MNKKSGFCRFRKSRFFRETSKTAKTGTKTRVNDGQNFRNNLSGRCRWVTEVPTGTKSRVFVDSGKVDFFAKVRKLPKLARKRALTTTKTFEVT